MKKYLINVGDDNYKAISGGWLTKDKERARKYNSIAGAKIGLANLRKHFKPYPNAVIEDF